MALKKAQVKEILSGAGVDAEHMKAAVDAILEGHGATVDALNETITDLTKERDAARAERDTYKTEAEKLPGVQKELDTLKGGDWQKKYEALKAETEAAAAKAAKDSAIAELLKDAFTPSGIDKIRKYADFSSVELDKDGKIKNPDKLLDSLKTEWAEFVTTTTTKGADIPNPQTPAATGTSFKTLTEAMEYANEHPGADINLEPFLSAETTKKG